MQKGGLGHNAAVRLMENGDYTVLLSLEKLIT